MNYYIKIKICHKESYIYYLLEIYQDSKVKQTLTFDSLSDAIYFTEYIIKNNKYMDEITYIYNQRKRKIR